jgi:hypothetical protein
MKVISEQEYMELLEMLKLAFAKIDERFDRIEQRLDKIEQRLDYHETWLKRIDTTINNNLVQKKDFNTLIKILESYRIISNSEASHFLVPTH